MSQVHWVFQMSDNDHFLIRGCTSVTDHDQAKHVMHTSWEIVGQAKIRSSKGQVTKRDQERSHQVLKLHQYRKWDVVAMCVLLLVLRKFCLCFLFVCFGFVSLSVVRSQTGQDHLESWLFNVFFFFRSTSGRKKRNVKRFRHPFKISKKGEVIFEDLLCLWEGELADCQWFEFTDSKKRRGSYKHRGGLTACVMATHRVRITATPSLHRGRRVTQPASHVTLSPASELVTSPLTSRIHSHSGCLARDCNACAVTCLSVNPISYSPWLLNPISTYLLWNICKYVHKQDTFNLYFDTYYSIHLCIF